MERTKLGSGSRLVVGTFALFAVLVLALTAGWVEQAAGERAPALVSASQGCLDLGDGRPTPTEIGAVDAPGGRCDGAAERPAGSRAAEPVRVPEAAPSLATPAGSLATSR